MTHAPVARSRQSDEGRSRAGTLGRVPRVVSILLLACAVGPVGLGVGVCTGLVTTASADEEVAPAVRARIMQWIEGPALRRVRRA